MIEPVTAIVGGVAILGIVWAILTVVHKRMNQKHEMRMKRLEQDHEIVSGMEEER